MIQQNKTTSSFCLAYFNIEIAYSSVSFALVNNYPISDHFICYL